METVSNLASGVVNTASRAIWGDGTTETKKESETAGTEPVSGETGNVAEGEPYDKGNLDSTDTETTKPSTTETTSLPSTTDTTTPSTAPDSTPQTLPIRSEHEDSKNDITSAHDPSSSLTSDDKQTSSNDTSGTGHTSSDGPPALTARPAEEHEAGQKGDKPLVEPKPAEETATIVGAGVVGGDGLQKQGTREVPAEKDVRKSTGEYANGGNFDAANPGAGKEADRLLDKKDIHHDSPVGAKPSSPTSSKSDSKADTPTKVSLKDKIKAKLHRNKDNKE